MARRLRAQRAALASLPPCGRARITRADVRGAGVHEAHGLGPLEADAAELAVCGVLHVAALQMRSDARTHESKAFSYTFISLWCRRCVRVARQRSKVLESIQRKLLRVLQSRAERA